MTIKAVIHTNQSSIDRVLQAGLPVVLVFWSPESLSRDTDALLDQLALEYGGRVLIAKVNASDEVDLARRYSVRHVPSYVFFKDKTQEATLPGPLAERVLRAWLRYLIEGGARPSSPEQPIDRRQDASGKPVHFSDSNFNQAIAGDQPVLVDFWAEWCGPCRMVAPSIEQLAQEFAGRVIVGKLNVDENPQTACRFNVMSIPALFIFKNGQVVDRRVGVQPLPALRQWLSQYSA